MPARPVSPSHTVSSRLQYRSGDRRAQPHGGSSSGLLLLPPQILTPANIIGMVKRATPSRPRVRTQSFLPYQISPANVYRDGGTSSQCCLTGSRCGIHTLLKSSTTGFRSVMLVTYTRQDPHFAPGICGLSTIVTIIIEHHYVKYNTQKIYNRSSL